MARSSCRSAATVRAAAVTTRRTWDVRRTSGWIPTPTRCTSPTATGTGASWCSTRRPAPTGGTGARTGSGRTTSTCPPTTRRPNRSATSRVQCMASRWRTTASCTSRTGRTTGCRCSRRTGRSSARRSSGRRRSAAARRAAWRCPSTRRSGGSSCRTARTTSSGSSTARRWRCRGASAASASTPASSTACTTWRSTRGATSTRRR